MFAAFLVFLQPLVVSFSRGAILDECRIGMRLSNGWLVVLGGEGYVDIDEMHIEERD